MKEIAGVKRVRKPHGVFIQTACYDRLLAELDHAWDVYQSGPTVDRLSAVWRALGAFLGKPAAN